MVIAKIQVTGVQANVLERMPVPAGIVGGRVEFVFDSSWQNLHKTVVFAGAVVKDVLNAGDMVTVPAECVAVKNVRLRIGVYGTDAAGALAIPTLWSDCGIVSDATDPSGDESADLALPVWAQLQAAVGDLTQLETKAKENLVKAINELVKRSGGTVDPAEVQKIVSDYLQENPPKADLTGVVKSVNGKTPDANGNVEIEVSGGNVDYVGVEPAEDDIPKVFITGVKPTTKDDVLAEMQYISKTDKFHAYLTIKCQGTSSMSYAKKNFTVKLYSDEDRETKMKKDFKDWNHPGNKFVLKANWIDHSHARNVVSARLWGEVVASRPDYDSLPVEMRNAPNNGAVDGFPIKVYYNGNYEGVYTWNIGKDDWMWGMDEDNPNHVLLCAEGNTDGTYRETASNFRALWSGVDGVKPGWSVEVGTNSTTLKNSLNALIQFVMDNDGEDFKNGIGTYMDIQSAIDYYIFQYVICGLDGLAHNMLLATYDGIKWRCGAYDLDATFGLFWNGAKFVSATYACPEDYQERYSLLWERIEANYADELRTRYAELRSGVLSYANMVTLFERFMDRIGLDLYAEDLTVYSGIPSGSTNNIQQIRNYIRDRLVYVDAEFVAMTPPVACTGISLNNSTLTFTTEGTQTLTATVTPDDCTEIIIWESDNTSVATVDGGVVTAIANGSANITAKCGNYSASCSVSVSGIAEPVACTGINLSVSTLTFTNTDSQSITATVTPDDCTDAITWASDNNNVATVTDGVVTPVASGTCNITATCGDYSATCVVDTTGAGFPEVALYPFVNASATKKTASGEAMITVEVTNGNHVRITTTGLDSANEFAVLSDLGRTASSGWGSTVGKSAGRWSSFSTVSSDTMEVIKKNVVVNTAPVTDGHIDIIAYANQTVPDLLKANATAEGNATTSFTSDTSFINIGAFIPAALAKQVWDIEFDIEIRVNGVLYV